MIRALLLASALLFVSLLVFAAAPVAGATTLVVHADELRTAAGEPIANGVVVVRDGRIAAVGALGSIDVPADAEELRAAVVTPGFIDSHTSVGLSGIENVASVRDQDEATDPDQADLRAIDAFNPRDGLLTYLLAHGVTVVQTGPGPRSPIAGQAGIFRTYGRSAEAMALRFPSALVFNLGETPKAAAGGNARFPSTRMGTAALIRRRLAAGRAHREGGAMTQWIAGAARGAGVAADAAKLDVLGRVALGELPAIFTAHRADDILTAVRIAREFELQAYIAGATEAYLVGDELAAAEIPLLLGPVMERVSLPERQNATFENAAHAERAGLTFALRSGFEGYVPKNRVVLFEAGVAVANGLEDAAALHAITLAPARLLGIDADHGSIELGKVADLVLFDGDPFEYTSHVEAVIGAGEVVHRR